MVMFYVLLVVAALVAIFSVQNAAPVTIVFLGWTFQASLAIVILLSAVAGAVLAASAFALMRLKKVMKKKDASVEHRIPPAKDK